MSKQPELNPSQQPTGWPTPRSQPPRKRHTGRNIALVIVGLFVVGIVAAAVAGGGGTATNTPAGADNAPTATSRAAGKTEGKPAGTVLLNLTGSGAKTTKKFSAARDWDLKWAYDCSG
jgi:hypothetical protein